MSSLYILSLLSLYFYTLSGSTNSLFPMDLACMCHMTTFMILLFLPSSYSYTSSHSKQRENQPEKKVEHRAHTCIYPARLSVIDHYHRVCVEIFSACWEACLEMRSFVWTLGPAALRLLRMIFYSY